MDADTRGDASFRHYWAGIPASVWKARKGSPSRFCVVLCLSLLSDLSEIFQNSVFCFGVEIGCGQQEIPEPRCVMRRELRFGGLLWKYCMSNTGNEPRQAKHRTTEAGRQTR